MERILAMEPDFLASAAARVTPPGRNLPPPCVAARAMPCACIDALRQPAPLAAQEDKEHEHDNTVTSVGIEREGACNMGKLQAWLSSLLRDKGADLFRSKGVLAVQGSDDR